MRTIVGLFDRLATANQVKKVLLEQGLRSSDASVMDQSKESYSGNYNGEPEHETLGERVKHFFGVFGDEEQSGHEGYTNGVERGGAILSVCADDDQASNVADLLHEYGASEVEDRYASASSANDFGDGRQAHGAAGREQIIPIVREELEVGKRQVNRGGVRVYSHIVEAPVSENISLHDERILVERRAVSRAATDADFASGSNVIELTATGEQAVISKRSRVVEEVAVGKVGIERTEQVTDTVRHTEVDVETLREHKQRY